jgi:hypothetical protein
MSPSFLDDARNAWISHTLAIASATFVWRFVTDARTAQLRASFTANGRRRGRRLTRGSRAEDAAVRISPFPDDCSLCLDYPYARDRTCDVRLAVYHRRAYHAAGTS